MCFTLSSRSLAPLVSFARAASRGQLRSLAAQPPCVPLPLLRRVPLTRGRPLSAQAAAAAGAPAQQQQPAGRVPEVGFDGLGLIPPAAAALKALGFAGPTDVQARLPARASRR